MDTLFKKRGLVVFIDVIIALLWFYWLFKDGFAYIGKLISLLLSPQQLFNLHWGTEWVVDRVFATIVFLLLSVVTVFLVWKLHKGLRGRQ